MITPAGNRLPAGRPSPELAASPSRVPMISRNVVSTISQRGWLESIWVGVALAVLVALLVIAIVRECRRRRRARWIAPGVTATLLVTVVMAAAFVNTYAGYVPDLQAADRLIGIDASGVRASSGLGTSFGKAGWIRPGLVRSYRLAYRAGRIPSSALWVYTPPGYSQRGNATRYPVVYLLHGYPGRASDWFAAGRADSTVNLLIANHDLPPVIVVAPDMNGGSFVRDTEGLNLPGGPQVETYLTRTVVTWVDTHLRTLAQARYRIIGGMSAGGSVALDLALRHQDTFGGIIAEEPYGDPGGAALAALHGNRAAYDAHSPDVYLPTMRFTRAMPTYIDVGALSDQFWARELYQLLLARLQPVAFRAEPHMEHTWTEARLGLAYGLVWTAAQLDWAHPIAASPHHRPAQHAPVNQHAPVYTVNQHAPVYDASGPL